MPAPSYRDYQLPSGRHGMGVQQVAANQRLRLIGAASDLLAEGRLLGLTSRLIARHAGVSSQTFYEHFENVDALLTAAFANAAQLLVELVAGRCTGDADRNDQIQKALAAAVSLGAGEPGLTALMRLEVAVAIPDVGAERERMLARFDGLLGEHGKGVFGRALVAGAVALAVERLEKGTADEEIALSRELVRLLG